MGQVDAVELEEEDPEEVNAHKLPVFSSRGVTSLATHRSSQRAAVFDERRNEHEVVDNSTTFAVRLGQEDAHSVPGAVKGARRKRYADVGYSCRRSGLAESQQSCAQTRALRSNQMRYSSRSLVTADILCSDPALGASSRPCASRGLKRRRVSERVVDQETASVDSPAICAVSPGEGILSPGRRHAPKGRRDRRRSGRTKETLTPGFSVREVTSFDDAALQTLSMAFAAEDPRVGKLPRGGPTGGVRGRAHVLDDAEGEAIGYTLTFENVAPPWDMERSLGLPPRLAHIFILRGWRRRGHLNCVFPLVAGRVRRHREAVRGGHPLGGDEQGVDEGHVRADCDAFRAQRIRGAFSLQGNGEDVKLDSKGVPQGTAS